MHLSITELILAAGALLLLGFLVHKYLPGSKVDQLGTAIAGEVKAFEPKLVSEVKAVEASVKAEAMTALTHVEGWLTDTTAETAAIATAKASMATKQRVLREHIKTLSAALPADPQAPA